MLMLLRAQRLETIGASWCIMAWITQRRLKKRNWTGGEVLLEAFTSAVKYCVHKRNVTVWYGAYILFISLIFLPLFYSRSLSLYIHLRFQTLFEFDMNAIDIHLRFYVYEFHLSLMVFDSGLTAAMCNWGAVAVPAPRDMLRKRRATSGRSPSHCSFPGVARCFNAISPRSKTEFQSKFERTGKIRQHDCSFILWRSVENYAIACNSIQGSWKHRISSNPTGSRPPATSSPPHNSARQATPFEANG